jgi:hypothetical protein
MQGKNASTASVGGGTRVDPGTYEAVLESIRAFTSDKYNAPGVEPVLTFVWNLGQDENGNEIRKHDTFIRIPLDREGYPYLNDGSKLYNRISAVFGERFDASAVDWEMGLPSAYDTPESLMELPHMKEAKEEGFRPIELKGLRVNGVDVIGKQAQITLIAKGDYTNVSEATPMPKKTLRSNPKQATDQAALPV